MRHREQAIDAHDLDRRAEGRAEAAVEGGQAPARETELTRERLVDAGRSDDLPAEGLRRLFAEHEAGEAHRVAAHVPEAAPALGIEAHVGLAGEVEGEGPPDEAGRPHRPARPQLAQALGLAVM